MTHGKFGSDPTADTTADEIELRKLQRIQNFEVVKDNVFDDVDVLVFIGRAAAGVSRPDYAGVLRQFLMKRSPVFFYRMNVGETMEIEQRGAVAVFQKPDLASVDIEGAPAQ